LSKAQYQATGRVLVVRIIFNDTTISRRLTNLALADVALNDSSQNMAGKLDFIKIRFDFWTAFCVSAKFGSYAARNMFP